MAANPRRSRLKFRKKSPIFGAILFACLVTLSESRDRAFVEKQRYDGWYNNLAHPDWGSADSQLTRKAPAFYSDGVYRMSGDSRPSPRTISQALMKGSDGLPSRRNRTALHTFFGKRKILSHL